MKTHALGGVVAIVCGLIACSSGSGSPNVGSGGSGGSTLTCADVCPSVLAAKCSNGPANESDCEQGCNSVRSGPCASAYDALLSCAGAHPQYSCSPSGSVSVVGCDTQNSALNNCIAQH